MFVIGFCLAIGVQLGVSLFWCFWLAIRIMGENCFDVFWLAMVHLGYLQAFFGCFWLAIWDQFGLGASSFWLAIGVLLILAGKQFFGVFLLAIRVQFLFGSKQLFNVFLQFVVSWFLRLFFYLQAFFVVLSLIFMTSWVGNSPNDGFSCRFVNYFQYLSNQ